MLIKYAKAKITRTASWDEIFLKDKKVRTASSVLQDKALDRIIQIKPIALNPEKYLYVQARAVSGGEKHGPNDNGDYFRWQELVERYMTFIGAAVNIDHKNNAPEWACGIIIDAQLNPGEWVEIVMAIDKAKAEKLYPGIIAKIESGVITDVSMGCLVEWSICSTCLRTKANGDESQLVQGQGLAMEPEDYCEHVDEESPAFCKGMEDQDGEICYEDNRGVTFFEESVITTQGADPAAKLGQRFASIRVDRQTRVASYAPQQTPTDKSVLAPYINFRSIENVRLAHLKRISKGDESMSTEKKPVVAAGPGKPTDTEQDKGDYGSAAEKDKALFDQSKGKSPKEDEKKGSQVVTMEDRGDYTLAALEAVKVLRNASKHDPKLIASLLPLIATEDGAEEKDEKSAEEVDMHKDKTKDAPAAEGAESTPEKKEVGEKPGAVEKGEDEFVEPAIAAKKDQKLSGKDSKFAAIKKALGDLTAAILGNPLETAKDAGDYDDGDKNKETKSVADSNASATESEKKAQDSAGNATAAEREKQVELAKKAAALKRKAENEDKKVDYVTSEMMKGKSFDDAMAEAEDRYKEDEPTIASAEEKEMKDGTDKTKDSPASTDKAEGENKMQDKELDQEKAGSSVEKPEVEREIAAGKKTAGAEEEKKETPAEEKSESKEHEKAEASAKEVVSKLDATAETMEDEEKKLKEEAATLASLGLSAEAKLVVSRIASIRKRVAILNEVANKIEDNTSRVAKIQNQAQKIKALGGLSTLSHKASLILAEVCKGEDEEKKNIEASMRNASKVKSIVAENAKMKAEAVKREAAVKRIARSQAVSSLMKTARDKGLIDEAQVASTIERWSKLSDEAFAEVKANYESARAIRKAGLDGLRRNVREAAAGLSRLADGQLDGVEAPITGMTKESDLDAQLADMFMDDARAMGGKRPRNGY